MDLRRSLVTFARIIIEEVRDFVTDPMTRLVIALAAVISVATGLAMAADNYRALEQAYKSCRENRELQRRAEQQLGEVARAAVTPTPGGPKVTKTYEPTAVPNPVA